MHFPLLSLCFLCFWFFSSFALFSQARPWSFIGLRLCRILLPLCRIRTLIYVCLTGFLLLLHCPTPLSALPFAESLLAPFSSEVERALHLLRTNAKRPVCYTKSIFHFSASVGWITFQTTKNWSWFGQLVRQLAYSHRHNWSYTAW